MLCYASLAFISHEQRGSTMSLHITNFAHLVNSSKTQNRREVTLPIDQASLVLVDIIELQNKLIETQEKLIQLAERSSNPTSGELDGGSF